MSPAQVAVDSLIASDAPWTRDWVWGLPLIVLTVIIHVLGLGFLSQKAIIIYRGLRKRRHTVGAFVAVMGTTTLLATILHGIEAGIWALAYLLIGARPDPRSAMLYSLGAITTYGHENLDLSTQWKLLGAIEALNGWLLFGLSTAFLFWLFQEVTPGDDAKP
jgi:MFS superfamily sulfate permease-like transporter